MPRSWGEKLELPHIEPKGEELTIKKGHSYRETSRFGPETLLRKKRSFKRGLIRKALLNAGEEPDFKEPIPAPPKPKATTIPIKEDKKYLYPGNQKKREARAVIIFMRDMSGSMTGEKTENDEPSKIPIRREYMDRFINPPEWLEGKQKREEKNDSGPPHDSDLPTNDLLAYLMKNGQLEGWERDIVSIVREESYYFAPQLMTKIMNEGWAAYWQSKIMAERGLATEEEIVNHADMHSRVLGGKIGINPYSLGKRLWEDIKKRWDKGLHGKDWEECEEREKLGKWDTKEMRGEEKMFEVRRNLNDVMFLDSFFRRSLFEDIKLFSYEWIPESENYHITSRDFQAIKRKLLFRFTNLGRPTIRVETGNYRNRGELLLIHEFDGVNLHHEDAKKVLKNTYSLWGRPVNLKTVIRNRKRKVLPFQSGEKAPKTEKRGKQKKQDEGIRLRYEGKKIEEKKLDRSELEELIVDDTDYDTLPAQWLKG